ncbi:synaptic vesicle transporter [Paraphaeosphaeria sporulosa]|uniref:Synaptic vesicle transporter n=1 Tax=Paraphaeosphaeria sporulosa TaxID=1460663 RepID=A0A177C0I1_9PLEO|nr:synaptic vesicle transporter [Paraphaeosphaeria sporulosa]OAG00120.1 synaptic vesicle transporter [Paraphaeosphaeria sporulosa]
MAVEAAVSQPHTESASPAATITSSNALAKVETNASALYDSIPMWRKCMIVFVTSWATLAACFSSTSLLSAGTEIAADLGGTKEAVSLSTGGVLLALGSSPLIWSPIAAIIGRRLTYNICLLFLFCFTIGAALAPNMRVFIAMRVLSGLQGCYFHVAGQTILAEYFPPIQRGTATGFFLAGTVLGPPLGPLVAGIMMTYSSWRSVLWLQVAMAGFAFVLALVFVPPSRVDKPGHFALNLKGMEAVRNFDPLPVFQQMKYRQIFFTHLSCGFLSWTQYSILASPRHILVERFGLISPLSSGLFYIAPATGFLVGTIVGGCYSDLTVRKFIKLRGERLPQDRLNSGMWSFFLVIPAASLIYGWSLQYCNICTAVKGGLALPIVTTFLAAAGLLAAFASLNTYCAEAIPKKRQEVITGKYLIQYTFSACASAGTVPLIDAIGIGPTATIGAVLCVLAGCLTFVTARHDVGGVENKEEKKFDSWLEPCKRIKLLPTNKVFPIA